jgi:hypothetical protein
MWGLVYIRRVCYSTLILLGPGSNVQSLAAVQFPSGLSKALAREAEFTTSDKALRSIVLGKAQELRLGTMWGEATTS